MSVKYVALAFLAALLVAVGWKYGGRVISGQDPDSIRKAKKSIEFDNGSIRDTTTIVTPASKGQPAAVGVLRRCERNGEITYTDTYCPKGSKESKVDKGTVNVIAESTKSTTSTERVGQKNQGKQQELTLQDKIIERAANPK